MGSAEREVGSGDWGLGTRTWRGVKPTSHYSQRMKLAPPILSIGFEAGVEQFVFFY